jgi:hypothetical protein
VLVASRFRTLFTHWMLAPLMWTAGSSDMSAALGPVNSFSVTVDAGPQYSSIGCSGSSCNLDINYFAKVYGGLSSPSGQFMKAIIKCACGPGYQAMTPAANYTRTSGNTSPTGSAGLTCMPCGAGWYRCVSDQLIPRTHTLLA